MNANVWIKAFLINLLEFSLTLKFAFFYQQEFSKEKVVWRRKGKAGESQYMKTFIHTELLL